MIRLRKMKHHGTVMSVLAISILLGVMPGNGFSAADKAGDKKPATAADNTSLSLQDVKNNLLKLTDGMRVKVVWNQGSGDKDMKLRLFDTKDASVQELPFAGSAPLISRDGLRVYASAGKAPAERAVMMYDVEKKKATELAKGPCNNLLAIWTDPKTRKDWVYVNDSGDKNESWNVPAGKIYRFPADKPAERELFWERTSSHIFLMFSEDGTSACFEPSWGNIGRMTLAFDAQGKVDQDKSTYKPFGGGCFPSIAPDNSYRIFRLEGDHHAITMQEGDGSKTRKVKVSEMPGVREKGRNTWLTRWSTHPRYMTLVAPAGGDARIWIGRFDGNYNNIEQWEKVVPDGQQCWQSQAWVEEKAK